MLEEGLNFSKRFSLFLLLFLMNMPDDKNRAHHFLAVFIRSTTFKKSRYAPLPSLPFLFPKNPSHTAPSLCLPFPSHREPLRSPSQKKKTKTPPTSSREELSFLDLESEKTKKKKDRGKGGRGRREEGRVRLTESDVGARGTRVKSASYGAVGCDDFFAGFGKFGGGGEGERGEEGKNDLILSAAASFEMKDEYFQGIDSILGSLSFWLWG